MASTVIKFTGTLPKINPDYLRCIYIYLVRGSDVLAGVNVQENGNFQLTLPRNVALASSSQSLYAAVGPAGMGKHLAHLPNLQRIPIKQADLEKADEFRISTEGLKLTEAVLNTWWTWCRWYCVSGNIVGPGGCPVPGAQVTVNSVGLDLWGFTETPEVTVNADPTGHFTACFCWCSCPYCFPCWPCWPLWWECWPWWWEFDMLYVIEALEEVQLQPSRSTSGLQTGAILTRPAAADLLRGQGFANARKPGAEFKPNPARTALVKSKLANGAIRAIFPYWWWCCDTPNIDFTVTQGSTVILDENPATDTRWCFPDGSTVTLVGNSQTIGACPGTPVSEPFVWTLVGNIPADSAHISGGYAVGSPGTDDSDLAFYSTLDIYGGFGNPNVAYYQVNVAPWTGDPSRGGTPPTTSSYLNTSLSNYVFIIPGPGSSTPAYSGPVQMGPFNQGGLTNLYVTQGARAGTTGPPPPPPGLSPFPTWSAAAGDAVIWAYDQLLISADSSAIVGGNVGSVDLTVLAYDSGFTNIPLPLPTPAPPPPDTSAVLTLTVDNTPVTIQQMTSITAYTAGTPPKLAPQTGTGECPAYDVGPGGYVVIETNVSDTNGHLYEYNIQAEWGHGNQSTVAAPGQRGYRSNPLTAPPPTGVCGHGDPDYSCKGWVGGTDTAYFPAPPGGTASQWTSPFGPTNPPPDCCYEFRIQYAKRVTDGYDSPTLADGDFQTISLKFSS